MDAKAETSCHESVEEDFLFNEDSDATVSTETGGAAWRVLVVDDDPDVHNATRLALSMTTILDRNLVLLHAYSSIEGRQVIEQEEDIAVILLDVVMETEDAGLRLVKIIREDLNRHDVRIILRTGQPGYAPEVDVIRMYDINDYRNKSEMTLARLVTALTSAIRSYDQIRSLTTLKSELATTLEDTIRSIAHTVEVRDPYTASHQRRVALLACAIARKMYLTEDQIKGIELAATIHDIGKLYVPSELLSKPAKLMDIEFKMVKYHVLAGYNIMKDIKFPWPIADVIYQHHEKLNGSGYPRGLSGDEIILESRIISVADVVEAMISHRPYRPALDLDEAIEEITAKKGIEFDPQVVDVCTEVIRGGIQLEGWA